MIKIEVEVAAVASTLTMQGPQHAIILTQVNGDKTIPIVVGDNAALGLIDVLSGKTTARPFTHQLMFNTLTKFGIEIQEVIIDKVVIEEGSSVMCSTIIAQKNGTVHHLESRTSDAIIMAVYSKKRIYVEEDLFYKCCKTLGASMGFPVTEQYKNYSINLLNKKLQESLDKEDYVEASKIRDEIKSRENVSNGEEV